jgi:hypothetical protein
MGLHPSNEWSLRTSRGGSRRYLGLDVLAKSQSINVTPTEEVTEPTMQALTA